MSWVAWLGFAVIIAAIAAVTGAQPKGTRPVAHTRLMGMARLVLLALGIMAALIWVALDLTRLAADAGARMVIVAAGGELAALAGEWGAPLIGLPDDIPMPRAGLGAMAIPTLTVLEDVGLFPGAREWARLAVEQLKVRRDELAKDDSSATARAQRIGRTFPLVYGGGALGGVAALRWKNQVVENAKCPSFCAQVPELMHNDIAGWGQHGDVTRQVVTIVNLRHDHEHPQLARRFELVREWTDEAVAGIEEVTAAGDGALAQLFDLMFQGDVTALHLAYQAGVDPGPIPVLDAIKAALND